jgi:hypothetical protein
MAKVKPSSLLHESIKYGAEIFYSFWRESENWQKWNKSSSLKLSGHISLPLAPQDLSQQHNPEKTFGKLGWRLIYIDKLYLLKMFVTASHSIDVYALSSFTNLGS